MGAAGRTGVACQEQETNGHQEHGRPGPLSWHMKHACEHERYFGKIATEAAIKSMLGAALPWASDHNQFQHLSHKTQDTDREAFSKVRLRGGPERIQIKVGRRSMRMSRSRDWDMTGHITGTHQPWFFGPA